MLRLVLAALEFAHAPASLLRERGTNESGALFLVRRFCRMLTSASLLADLRFVSLPDMSNPLAEEVPDLRCRLVNEWIAREYSVRVFALDVWSQTSRISSL